MTEFKGDPFAVVKWRVEDVMSLSEDLGFDWDEDRANQFIENNEGRMADRLTELGWQVMGDLIPLDGEIA